MRMSRRPFLNAVRSMFAKKHKKRISYNDLSEIFDCMADVFVNLMQSDNPSLRIDNVVKITKIDQRDRLTYNPLTGENKTIHWRCRLVTVWSKNFKDRIDKWTKK